MKTAKLEESPWRPCPGPQRGAEARAVGVSAGGCERHSMLLAAHSQPTGPDAPFHVGHANRVPGQVTENQDPLTFYTCTHVYRQTEQVN